MDYIKLPKAELHCHLDGSINQKLALELCRQQGLDYDMTRLQNELTVEAGCTSLAEYLDKFTLPLSLLQTKEALRLCTYRLLEDASKEGISYIEMRFAPTSHHDNLSYTEIFESVLDGLRAGEKDFGIYGGIIVCAMRHLPDETNIKMFEAAREYLGHGVVACDLAGGEVGNPISKYKNLFGAAAKLGMPYTIHGGEQSEVSNVTGAIELGASRIGHGVAIANDEAAKKMVKEKDILLEICPTSNLQTKAVDAISRLPILEFLESGIKFTINTDNRTVSGINLLHEYELLTKQFNLTESDYKKIYKDAIEKSFASDEIKGKLLN